jgi:pyruvate dehydrogenase E1 component
VTLLGSGAIFTEVIQAAQRLAERGIGSDVYSITSWSELARDGMAHESDYAEPYLSRLLGGSSGPILAATDYVRAVPETVRAYLPAGRGYRTLGTDGFGRSDTRAVLRSFFQVDAESIVSRALAGLGVNA